MLPDPLQQIDRTWVLWRKQVLAYFAGCDYFRLSSHPAVLAAARAALDIHGLNVAASRYTTGNHILYENLEHALQQFFKIESALLISNGYLTNLAVVQGLNHEFTHILIDERAHSSLCDAAALGSVPIHVFRHRDIQALRQILDVLTEDARPLVMTDSIFAHDGSKAAVSDYLKILPANAWLLADDSHGLGEPFPFGPRLIRTITLSKAFGSYGGAILSTREVREKIESKSRAIAGATPFPLPMAGAARMALNLLVIEPLRECLQANIARFSSSAKSQIISIAPSNEAEKNRIIRSLLARGIFPSFIRYQQRDYFRFAISSEHSRAQLDALAAALKD